MSIACCGKEVKRLWYEYCMLWKGGEEAVV